ncbi:hypothetical protein ACWCQ0_47340, partial [Streptomyces massasporeus]
MRLLLPHPRSLAGQLFAMQVVLVAVVVAGCAVFAYVTDRAQAEENARRQATATAAAVADSPSVVAAARSADPTAVLQPYAEALRRHAGVAFVVIMAPDGTRWTHPEPEQIGRTYLGHIEEAAAGRTHSETHLGCSEFHPLQVRGAGSGDRARRGTIPAGPESGDHGAPFRRRWVHPREQSVAAAGGQFVPGPAPRVQGAA